MQFADCSRMMSCVSMEHLVSALRETERKGRREGGRESEKEV